MGITINKKTRFATEGFRTQRNNADGTIPTPRRFVGFANTADLTKVLTNGKAPLTIRVDSEEPQTRTVDFSGALNPGRVTVQEAVAALTAADFPLITWEPDSFTGRLKGGATGAPAVLTVELTTTEPHNIPAATFSLFFSGNSYLCKVPDPIAVTDDPVTLIFTAATHGEQAALPSVGQSVDLSAITPSLPGTLLDWSGEFVGVAQGYNPSAAEVIQVVGQLAAALDFGQGVRHAGNGLEIRSYFDDDVVSIGLPKSINDKEEIDTEGALGTITRMVIGAKILGKDPVIVTKEKDYYLLELIQGGHLDRETGAYNPPLSGETDHPSFHVEIFSAVFGKGSNKYSDMAGYERMFLRSVTGVEGDVPIEAKSWAQYAYNCTATEYTDEMGVRFPAWEERLLSVEQFDALRVNHVSFVIPENPFAAESR